MKADQEEAFYRTYTADSLHFILRQLGIKSKLYSEITNPKPKPVDNRSPEEIARERVKKLGLKVVA